jgi:purine-nucleoside phosphorylase
MKGMGIKYLMVSNAAGGLNPEFKAGDIMLITDHINLFPEHPLRGKNEDSIGTRFPDMNNAYNRDLIALAEKVAASNNIPYKKGVYVGTQGPTFETVAEYKYFRLIGGDTCGMSTVPEIIVAHWAGIKCFGVSIVSNALGDALNGIETNHEEVQRNTNIAKDNLKVLFREMVKAMQNL